MFKLNGSEFESMAEAAQEAEFCHAETGHPQSVVASVDCPYGMFKAGEVVYTSKGAPE